MSTSSTPPFKSGDIVKDRFSGNVRGIVVRCTRERNSLDEPFWFVVVHDQHGDVGSDARDLIHERPSATARYIRPQTQPNPATHAAQHDFAMSFGWYKIGMEGNEIMLRAVAHALEAPGYPFSMNVEDIEVYL